MLATAVTETEAGREAADRLAGSWPDASWVPRDPSSREWAQAAIERFGELISEQRAMFRSSQAGAERGARSLSPRTFQGLLESLQNADDLGARELRIGIRSRAGRRELMIVHDGERVQLHHVGAMLLPWLSTKTDDPEASGRFGIGQKTLRAIGTPISLHCDPFHFEMRDTGPRDVAPVDGIPGFYDASQPDTLVSLPLRSGITNKSVIAFLRDELTPRSLLFLKSVRRLSFVEIPSGDRIVDHRISEESTDQVSVRIGRSTVIAKRTVLRETGSRRRHARYMADVPLTKTERRHEKATGDKTTVGVAIPLHRPAPGLFFDRLPMPIQPGLLFSVNAQFDPDAARSTLLSNDWNTRRLNDIADLTTSACLDAFARDPAHGWAAVPLAEDLTLDSEGWLGKELTKKLIGKTQQEVAAKLRLEDATGKNRRLADTAYEEDALGGLLNHEDLTALAPHKSPLRETHRDEWGRWRTVLDALDLSQRISVEAALELFDQDDELFGDREPEWFVAMADVAFAEELLDEFLSRRSMLLADGRRVESPGASDPRSLVRELEDESLAAALDIALSLHGAYSESSDAARRVVSQLGAAGVLMEDCHSPDAALRVLSRDYDGNTIDRVRVGDKELIALRSAFERLSRPEQRKMGPRVGRNIELRSVAFTWDGESEAGWTSPGEAYLPKKLDKHRDAFENAAAETPDISWLDSSYAKLLKREGGHQELGAQAFLVLLGAETVPRLSAPAAEQSHYRRDPRPSTALSGWPPRPDLQRAELDVLHPRRTHLLDDRESPDLQAVIADIVADDDHAERQKRALHLLGALARSWERLYAEHTAVKAVYAYDGHYHDPHTVTATWLAEAAEEEWLPNAAGDLAAPCDLCLRTEANELQFGDSDTMFLPPLREDVTRSAALPGLKLRLGPSAAGVVERLKLLRAQRMTAETEHQARVAYQLLSAACASRGNRRLVDDLPVSALRSAFSGGRGRRGLILAGNEWLSPKHVFRGPKIFGNRRAFAPGGSTLDPLWTTLGVEEPAARDCIDVLREVSETPLSPDDKPIMLAALRHLARHIDELSPTMRSRLRKLPLWDGKRWIAKRPVLALEDDSFAAEVSKQVPVWCAGFTSYDDLPELLPMLGVTLVRPEQFTPKALNAEGHARGQDLRRRFAAALTHLQSELVRGDKKLCDSLAVPWKRLASAPIHVQPDTTASAEIDGLRLTASPRAHMSRDPLAFVLASADDAGLADTGGKAIASLFTGDRQKVAWAWATMWQRAEHDLEPETLALPETEDEDDAEDFERLMGLQHQGKRRQRRGRGSKGPGSKGARRHDGDSPPVQVRKLKDLSRLEPDGGRVVNGGRTASGLSIPKPVSLKDPPQSNSDSSNQGSGSRSRSTARSVLPPVDEREQLALDAVRTALALDDPEIQDLRKRRGIGADLLDEFRQYFELKMASGRDFPAEITLTRSEVSRAQMDPDFFLAVVAGLEDAEGELRVRFIFDPLKRLAVRIKGEVTLTGIDATEALEYRFGLTQAADPEVPEKHSRKVSTHA